MTLLEYKCAGEWGLYFHCLTPAARFVLEHNGVSGRMKALMLRFGKISYSANKMTIDSQDCSKPVTDMGGKRPLVCNQVTHCHQLISW